MAKQISIFRQRQREAAVEAMLDSAEQAIIRHGYERATMQQIADAAGCAAGTFYLYFKNKEELFQAIVARHSQAMHDRALAERDKTDDPLEKLRLGCGAFLHYADQHRAFFRLFFAAMPMRHRAMLQNLPSPAKEDHERLIRQEVQILREAQERGLVRDDLPAEILHDFMINTALNLVEQFVCADEPQSVDHQVHVIWELTTGGIRAGRKGHGKS